jgi:choline monooxygenase
MKKTCKTEIYANNSVFNKELSTIFKNESIYLGHEKMIPELGSYCVSPRFDNELIFLRNQSGIECIKNICQHHQALILKNSGKISSINCPFHRWNYNLEGQLIKAPHFETVPCVSLKKQTVFEWNNLFFIQKKPLMDTNTIELLKLINFEDYIFHSTETFYAPYNWKIFIENYLDDYHVPAIHPGLRSLVDVQNLEWYMGNGFNFQMVDLHKNTKKSNSEKFMNYSFVLQEISKSMPLQKMIWMTIYPSTMIEVYPYMILISTLKPISANETINHIDFFFDLKALTLNPDFANLSKAFYLETAKEDDEICRAIQLGKQALYRSQSELEIKPEIHPILEKGIYHFHDYLETQYQNIEFD